MKMKHNFFGKDICLENIFMNCCYSNQFYSNILFLVLCLVSNGHQTQDRQLKKTTNNFRHKTVVIINNINYIYYIYLHLSRSLKLVLQLNYIFKGSFPLRPFRGTPWWRWRGAFSCSGASWPTAPSQTNFGSLISQVC